MRGHKSTFFFPYDPIGGFASPNPPYSTDSNGLTVWEEEKQITKQGKRGVIGW